MEPDNFGLLTFFKMTTNCIAKIGRQIAMVAGIVVAEDP